MSEVADLLRYSRSRLSHAVARLEDAGWVVREPCETDRRGFHAVLTDAGFGALEEAAPRHVEGVRSHLFDQLDGGQVEQLREMSEALLDHLTEVTAVETALRGGHETEEGAR
jgi:DNA-binding MarR family transcriptional regulator